MKWLNTASRIGLSLVLAVLAGNAGRLAMPMARAQMVSVVPYTVVLAETITLPTGQRKPGPMQTAAGRSDGSVVTRLGLPSQATRQIHFASGLHVNVNDMHRVKSTTQRAIEYPWARDARQSCTTRVTGQPLKSQGEPVVEQVAGYRAVRIQQSSTTTMWFALDHGCALIKQRMDFGAQGSSDLELMSLTPGEPDLALFAVPAEYTEGPPSSFPTAQQSPKCSGQCEKDQQAFLARIDEAYYRHRP